MSQNRMKKFFEEAGNKLNEAGEKIKNKLDEVGDKIKSSFELSKAEVNDFNFDSINPSKNIDFSNPSKDLNPSLIDISAGMAAVALAPIIIPIAAIHFVHPRLGESILRRMGVAQSDAPPEDDNLFGTQLNAAHQLRVNPNQFAINRDYYNVPDHFNNQEAAHMIIQEAVNGSKYADYDFDTDIPYEYQCPLTLDIMDEPLKVITKMATKDGEMEVIRHYEKTEYEKYVQSQNGRTILDPLNRLPVIKADEIDLTLQEKINEFVKEHGKKNHHDLNNNNRMKK